MAAENFRRAHLTGGGDLLYVAGSRLIYEKGYDLLIEAMARGETATRERICLILVGTGNQEAGLRRLVGEKGLTEMVSFLGWMTGDEFQVAVAAADVFIHPARLDAFGGGTLFAIKPLLPGVAA